MPETTRTRFPPELRRVLRRLRRRIRRHVLLEALALLLILVGGLFWLGFGLDWAYFQLNKLELPLGFRTALQWAVLVAVPVVALRLIAPLFRVMRPRALALVLEKRFPQLDDRLITAVETAEQRTRCTSPLTQAMLQRTVEDVSRVAEKLQVSEVFERRALRRYGLGALAMLLSVAALYGINQEALARWKSAYVNLEEKYWPRTTHLRVKVVAQPGDRVRDFRNSDGEPTAGRPGRYKHPRGDDLTLRIDVPQQRPDGTPWQVPDRVRLEYRFDGGRGGGRVSCLKIGDRRFKYSLGDLLDGLSFHVTGGDFTNRQPYRVDVVEPPRVDRVALRCNYPDYTALDGTANRERVVHGTQISLPMETVFVMDVTANKPLHRARIRTEAFEIKLSEEQATMILPSKEGEARPIMTIPSQPDGPRLAGSDGTFRIPFRLTDVDAGALAGSTVPVPIPLPPETLMRIYLHDTDDIVGSEPARLTVGGIADQPPVVETELHGVGEAITRKAVIPVRGRITDDYGIAGAQFKYRIDDSEWKPFPLQRPPQEGPQEFRLGAGAEPAEERFEVLPLDLSVGQRLTLTVSATDGDNLNGPHVGRGRRYAFRIVSPQELLSILYSRELNLRLRFEQIIREVEKTREDIQTHRAQAVEARELRRQEALDADEEKQLGELRTAVGVAAQRALHQVRKNANETAAVEEAFREIREELVNNAVQTSQMVSDMEQDLVRPLQEINTTDFPAADEAISLYRLAAEKRTNAVAEIDESLRTLDTLLAHMRQVLKKMRDLVERHELVRDLKALIEKQRQLAERTKEQRKKDLLDRLRGDDSED